MNWDTIAIDQHLNQNTIATNQDLGSLRDEINGINPLMSLHKHEKMKMREKTSKTKHELHIYSRKRHLQRKKKIDFATTPWVQPMYNSKLY